MPANTASNAEDRMETIASKAREHASDAAKTVGAAASDLKDTATTARDDLAEQVSMLRLQLEELATSVAQAGQEKAQHVMHEARLAGRKAARTAGQGYEAAADYAEGAYAGAEKFTAERPATAIGIAAALGLLAGLVLGRR